MNNDGFGFHGFRFGDFFNCLSFVLQVSNFFDFDLILFRIKYHHFNVVLLNFNLVYEVLDLSFRNIVWSKDV